MTKTELAATLNGRQYGDEITEEEEQQAEASGLIVLFGYGDDNIELRGSIDDEVSLFDGGTIYLHRGGILDNPDHEECERCQASLRKEQTKCVAIECRWDDSGYSWFITPATRDGVGSPLDSVIQFAPFDILEGADKFCRGIVIELKDLPTL